MKQTLERLTLTLDVTINPHGETRVNLMDSLAEVARRGVNDGTLLGDSEATLERFKITVKARKPKTRTIKRLVCRYSYVNVHPRAGQSEM